MRNVIVFALGQARFAVEIRWVREIFTIGWITPLPWSPRPIAGVTNVRGSIVPVLVGAESQVAPVHTPRSGDPAILLEVEDTRVALAVGRIDEVTTLDAGAGPDLVRWREGQELRLVNPENLVRNAKAEVHEWISRSFLEGIR